MKKSIFTMLFVAIAIGAFAQMQVWSNGTIIFSHNVNDVDSISFAGSPIRVQTKTATSASTSFEGKIYKYDGCFYWTSQAKYRDYDYPTTGIMIDISTGTTLIDRASGTILRTIYSAVRLVKDVK